MTILFDDDERDSQEEEDTEQDSASQGDDTSSASSDGSSTKDDTDDEYFDRERATQTIRTLRQKEKERNQFEKELQRLRKEQDKRTRAEQSELERLKSDLEERDRELESLRNTNNTYQSRLERSAFMEQIGYDNRIARLAWNSLDDAGAEPEFDDKWRLQNKKQVAKALRDYDPDMFGTGSSDAGKRERNVEGEVDMNALIRQGFGR